MIFTDKYPSPLGDIILAAEGDALCGLWFTGQKYFGGAVRDYLTEGQSPVFAAAREWLDAYFAGKMPDPSSLRLRPAGASEFRTEVWEILLAIPYGEVTTYGAIAAELARRRGVKTMSAQAVGGAVGHNPISIIIPCHRVVGASGALTGYAGGLDRKAWLLSHEGYGE